MTSQNTLSKAASQSVLASIVRCQRNKWIELLGCNLWMTVSGTVSAEHGKGKSNTPGFSIPDCLVVWNCRL